MSEWWRATGRWQAGVRCIAAALAWHLPGCASPAPAEESAGEVTTAAQPELPATAAALPGDPAEATAPMAEAGPVDGVNEGLPAVTVGELAPPEAAEPLPPTQPAPAAQPEPSPVPATPPPFSIDVLTRAGIGGGNSTGWPNTGAARGPFDWRQAPFARVTLVVDLESTCYPFETWVDNPPPPGQNWPANCDAFDRNFNVFVEAPGPAPGAPFEVVHAITPFGGPEHLEVDLTDLANALPGAHQLRVAIDSFSDPAGLVTGSNGGWTVSARLDVTPGPAPRAVLAALPLFAGRLQAGGPAPLIAFEAPPGTTGGRLEYRTSGHGQGMQGADCIGPAEEFCSRRHRISVDGVQVQELNPIRVDCASLCTLTHYGPAGAGFDYCLENPGGLPESVRAPRANWCPGSMTPPFAWSDIPALAAPGPHTLSFEVSTIEPGGNWLASAIYYAYGAQSAAD